MPIFNYSARDTAGQLVRETVAFNNELSLREYLRKNNLFVLDVAEQRRSNAFRPRRRVGLGDLIIMTRQLRTMINAGMPLVTGLEALAEQSTNPALVEILRQIGRSVGHGASLAGTFGDYPTVFPPIMIALIRSGEDSGRLPESLLEASRQLEFQMEIRQKMVSAMVYPVFTLAATVATVLVMIVWIVPIFANIYRDLNAQLPPITLTLVWVSELVVNQGWMFGLAVLAAGIAFARYYRTPEGRYNIDGWKLKLPLLGSLINKSASANLTGSLAGLVDSGVPLIQALETAAGVCGNEVLARAVRAAAANVVLGRRLSDELEASGRFPMMVTRMIAIAEDVGTLPMVLREIAAAYIQDVEYAMRRILGLIEPILVLTVGAIVGFVLVALYYPIFILGDVFLKGS